MGKTRRIPNRSVRAVAGPASTIVLSFREFLTRILAAAHLAQMQARKAMLQAQAVLLRAQESCLDAAGAAD